TMSLPRRTSMASALTFFAATLVNWATSPLCNDGAPQQFAPSTSEHSIPFRSYTFTRSWPMDGCWYSTVHVGNRATRPWRLAMRTLGRRLNQVVNRCRAYGGSRRTLDTPVVISTALRTMEPGLAPSTVLAHGADMLAGPATLSLLTQI